MVVWSQGGGQNVDVYAGRVTTSGVVLDPSGIPVTTAPNSQYAATLAWGSSSYLVAWFDYASEDIYAGEADRGRCRSRSAGDSRDQGGRQASGAVVGRSGSRFVVTWNKINWNFDWSVLAARVSDDGELIDDPPQPIAVSPNSEYWPRVASGPQNQLALCLRRIAPEPPWGGPVRDFVRFVDAGSDPAPPPISYSISTESGQSIVPGTTDIGNHCDDCLTEVDLPFPVTLYGVSYSRLNVSANGNVQFYDDDVQWANSCFPSANLGRTIAAYWDDLLTYQAGKGVFTAALGSPPNRQFVIEWRATYVSDPTRRRTSS